MIKRILIVTAALTASWSALAGNPIQKFEFVYEELTFYPCLGEDVLSVWQVTSRFREAQTPSGIVQIVDKWSLEGTAVGQTSGFIWNVSGQSPYTGVFREEGESQFLVAKVIHEPINEGPRLLVNQNAKITVNANGELVVLNRTYEDRPDKWCKLLGPKD